MGAEDAPAFLRASAFQTSRRASALCSQFSASAESTARYRRLRPLGERVEAHGLEALLVTGNSRGAAAVTAIGSSPRKYLPGR